MYSGQRMYYADGQRDKANLGYIRWRTLELKKDLKIPYVSHILKRYILFPSPGHSGISADAVASFIEKSCLVAHAFEHVFRSVKHY